MKIEIFVDVILLPVVWLCIYQLVRPVLIGRIRERTLTVQGTDKKSGWTGLEPVTSRACHMPEPLYNWAMSS